MFDIQIEDKVIKPQELLSFGKRFLVYKGIDQFNNEYSIKRSACNVEGLSWGGENNRQFNTYSSLDLFTSAYYGHVEIDVDFSALSPVFLNGTPTLKFE